ncbi:MAG: carbohydrate ABC transporter permease [Eubacteriales bacterium]|nr:carbohydrate ABC transporter permease [Eubacteriales bacterium]
MENKKKRRPGRALGTFCMNAVPVFYAATCIFPVIWLFYTTFKTQEEFSIDVLALPKSWGNLANYAYVLTQMPVLRAMWNTLRITVIVLFFVLAISFINGYFLARFRFKGKQVISVLYMSNLLIPIHAILVPIYILFVKIGLSNHWYSTILPCICMELTTAIFLVWSYVDTIPRELEEAAAIDGSSFSRTLFTILLPLLRPVLVTCGIISFFHVWNEFPFSLILFSSEKDYTLPLMLMRFKGEYFTDYPRVMTSLFVSIVPALVIYALFSQQIIKGMMAGAVKG